MSVHADNDECIMDLLFQMFYTTKSDIDGMISQALLVGNFEAAVDICVGAD